MPSFDADFHGADPAKTPGYDVEPRRRGCLFYGCVAAIVLSVLLALALALGGVVFYRTLKRYRDVYTSTSPVELPKLAMGEQERKGVVDRLARFRKAVEAGEDVGPLRLTGDDLNALIQEEWPKFKDRVYLSLVDDQVRAKVSIPLSEIKDISFTRGRYLNGEAELKLSLRDRSLRVEVVSMLVDGKELPEPFRGVIDESNIDLDEDEDDDDSEGERRVKGLIRRLESLEVEDGVVIVTPRKPGPKADAPADPPKSEEPPGPAAPSPPAEPGPTPAPPDVPRPATGTAAEAAPPAPASAPSPPAPPG